MIRKITLIAFLAAVTCFGFSFRDDTRENAYRSHYREQLRAFNTSQKILLDNISKADLTQTAEVALLKNEINKTRLDLKKLDFWLRYLEPVSYKRINGPLPIEWETEVFEKFEKPYRREGAGLTLAWLYLGEDNMQKDSLAHLVLSSLKATSVFYRDSIVEQLQSHHHFFLCNRLFLLNLAAIYSTGFECPDAKQVIPELLTMLESVKDLYTLYNQSFVGTQLSPAYLDQFDQLLGFVQKQPKETEVFDHFTFIRDFVNPLFKANQQFIENYEVNSKSYLDYSLNKNAQSIFSKALYRGQNTRGIYLRVHDQNALKDIEAIGKLLFYDPILSGNNLRSCASCHKPSEFFTDTTQTSALQFDRKKRLPRNTPSLLNVNYNHLIMADGRHYTLQEQARAVITNPDEMACDEKEILEKILSCGDYKKAFTKFLGYTPVEKNITLEHISSALTIYYSKFSRHYSDFDMAMNSGSALNEKAKAGFNLFMGKAQCATCHFVPQFNGVKPPYIGSEFEVLGVPKDSLYQLPGDDLGRYGINPAAETHRAFRTGTLRNSAHTKPYMHNGVFSNLDQLLEFYNGGGGAGRGLSIPNQTLSSDSLHLTKTDKANIIAFIHSLNENIETELPPSSLPVSKNKKLNNRKVGGEY